jgi:hypothetical protein
MENIRRQNEQLREDLSQRNINKTLLGSIDRWEKESIEKIRSTADQARTDLKRLVEQSNNRLSKFTNQLTDEIRWCQDNKTITEKELDQWAREFEELRKEVKPLSKLELFEDDSSALRLIKVKNGDKNRNDATSSSFEKSRHTEQNPSQVVKLGTSSQDGSATTNKSELSTKINAPASQPVLYLNLTFGLNESSHQDVKSLFERLMLLTPMDKNGPMNGKCHLQTEQMEQFLSQTFGFKNIPEKYIVQGVKSFQLDKPPHYVDPKKRVYFPSDTTNSFTMAVEEIIRWQRSYAVYADKNIKGINKEFLYRALQGQSEDGEEAFRMKFVVRISTCPILMEFDAKIIPRKLDEDWPNRIKLVSVTGIDFAGRKHDVFDILQYVSNWKDIYEIDPKTDLPFVYNGRDFRVKRKAPPVKLQEDLLLKDLKYMARLRLQACDLEGVKVVVETGIGLGVFSGKHIGIDGNVRLSSALAIRTVLEEDGPNYKNIRAVVFALPIIDDNNNSERGRHCFSDFVDQFQEPQYNGPIPVLIADQDMHRLTVAIALHGFIVSQLNPADSHGVFGEYWQNRGPAVEEKLALTTLGLLVQHHLINREVLDTKNYHLI